MKRMIKYMVPAFVALAMQTSFAIGQSADSLIYKANEAYNQGLYDSAIATYERVLDENLESYRLYYNIGNAYFKNNDIPSAILYYEKAKKLAPNDEDVSFNLSIANSMIVDKIEKVPEMFYQKWWNYFYNMFDADTWTVISVVSWLVLLLLIGVFILAKTRRVKKMSFYFGLLFLFTSLATFGLASQKYYYTKEHKDAIVFTPTITAKSSPTRSAVDLFVIHEGTKVRIVDQVQGWVKIKLHDGSIGWLPGDAVKRI